MVERLFSLVPVLLSAAILLTACGAGGRQDSQVKLAPISALPKQVQDAPAAVRTAYQFAVANPDALQNVPCYCGCGAIGHTSNLACYIKEFGADDTQTGISDKPVFDDHAMGCSLCVDIATDVMKMTSEGKSPSDIRQQIVATYSKFGPANQ